MDPGQRARTLRRRLWAFPVAAAVLVASCAAHDAVVAPPRQFATRAAVAAIEQYRARLSSTMGRFVQCRFVPSCSAYGLEMVKRHGAYRGGLRALGRIARCNPATPMGTVDPPD